MTPDPMLEVARLFLWAGGRPTWQEFLAMSDAERAALAVAGKEHALALAGLAGVASQSPGGARATLEASQGVRGRPRGTQEAMVEAMAAAREAILA